MVSYTGLIIYVLMPNHRLYRKIHFFCDTKLDAGVTRSPILGADVPKIDVASNPEPKVIVR
jgi:hypothetical protein